MAWLFGGIDPLDQGLVATDHRVQGPAVNNMLATILAEFLGKLWSAKQFADASCQRDGILGRDKVTRLTIDNRFVNAAHICANDGDASR